MPPRLLWDDTRSSMIHSGEGRPEDCIRSIVVIDELPCPNRRYGASLTPRLFRYCAVPNIVTTGNSRFRGVDT
jgi:hypothetical protein